MKEIIISNLFEEEYCKSYQQFIRNCAPKSYQEALMKAQKVNKWVNPRLKKELEGLYEEE